MVLRADIGIRSGRRKLAFCFEYFRSDWRVIKSWNISAMAAQFIGCVSIWPLLLRKSNLLEVQSVCSELAECSMISQSNRQDECRTEAVIEAVSIVMEAFREASLWLHVLNTCPKWCMSCLLRTRQANMVLHGI